MKLRYVDFWPGFQAETFLLTQVLSNITENPVKIVDNHREVVDLEIASVFCFDSIFDKARSRIIGLRNRSALTEYISRSDFGCRTVYRNPSRKRIWFTAENRRPNVSIFNATISFDPEDKETSNFFFPYFYFSIDWYGLDPHNPLKIKAEELVRHRDQKPRNLSACSFSSNVEPLRQRIIEQVRRHIDVVEYGSAVGNRVTSKFDTAKEFSFQICNENSFAPGYVTEKLIESWIMGNVPIWAGDYRGIPINPESFIDVSGLNSEEIANLFQRLTEEEVIHIRNQPLMLTEPSIKPLEDFLSGIIS